MDRRLSVAWAILTLVVAAVELGGCNNILDPLLLRPTDAGALEDGSPRDPDAFVPAFESWGAHAASLSVPPCSGALVLEVNDTTDELTGGESLLDIADAGPTLSFVEALRIAANRSETAVINFAEEVFPADRPATIVLPPGCRLPWIEDTCIDARARGVIIDFQSGEGSRSTACALTLHRNAQAIGLELRRMQWQVVVGSGSQLAGCRVNTDGETAIFASEPEGVVPQEDAMIGPGNSFGFNMGVVIKGNGGPMIVENYFGFDPVTGRLIDNYFGVQFSGIAQIHESVQISGNVFRSVVGVNAYSFFIDSQAHIDISNNTFESPEAGGERASVGVKVAVSPVGAVRVGPGNRFVGLDTAIEVYENRGIVTRNEISGCSRAIDVLEPVVEAPTILAAEPTFVEGNCPASGVIEVFSTADDQADAFVGDVSCESGETWRLDGQMAGRRVTATLTTTAGTSALSPAVDVAR